MKFSIPTQLQKYCSLFEKWYILWTPYGFIEKTSYPTEISLTFIVCQNKLQDTPFYLLDYVTPTETFQIGDHKNKIKMVKCIIA